MITYKEKPNTEEEIGFLLNPIVKKWFFTRFKSFSLPQLYGVFEIHSRNNVLVSAPTGATKTLTAFLSILNELVDSSVKGVLEDKVYCVYVSPLKALNEDIKVNLLTPLKEIEEVYGKKLGVRISVRTGDTTQSEKSLMLKHPPHILITTPESLAIMLASIKFKNHLSDVNFCIIDEIHAIAENKRGVHLSLSIERLARLSKNITRVGLSATISPLDKIAEYLVGFENDKARDCKIINVNLFKENDLDVLTPVADLVETSYEVIQDKLYGLIHSEIQKHSTTLIFTNTRAATERVVDNLKDKYKSYYNSENIGAHHSSLPKEHRTKIEEKLRKGELKCVVCSTSLELGIDIGTIDMVLCLGSPKSVARFLQRAGRSGHKLNSVIQSRLIVLDRDDLVECSILLKCAIEKKIDSVHIPENCLDVLAQHIHGITLGETINVNVLYSLVKNSYSFHRLKYSDLIEVIEYLSGEYVSLEERHIYGKIWFDKEHNEVSRRGKMSRVIHMTNIGTIPEESFITVKIVDQTIGYIDEGFLENLKPGDVFVLGGNTYEFKFARGMVAQVKSAVQRPPTVPSWFSEMLPLSFDLASEIGRFRRLCEEKFLRKKTKDELIEFIREYSHCNDKVANAIYDYFKLQFDYKELPSDKKILIEHYNDGKKKMIVFHTLFGRRVNDCLSRAVGFAVARANHIDVEIGINDNGFYVSGSKGINITKIFPLITTNNIESVLVQAIDNTEVLKRRFRHCAMRSLMILRNYQGKEKYVGRQQVSSMILLSAVRQINKNFSILKEARREILEDLMDITNTKLVLENIKKKDITIKEIWTDVPTPFAFNLVMQGYSDILKIDDKYAFLQRMHSYVKAKISLKK